MFYPTFSEEYSDCSQWELRADVSGKSLENFYEPSLCISPGTAGQLAKHRCSSGGDVTALPTLGKTDFVCTAMEKGLNL